MNIIQCLLVLIYENLKYSQFTIIHVVDSGKDNSNKENEVNNDSNNVSSEEKKKHSLLKTITIMIIAVVIVVVASSTLFFKGSLFPRNLDKKKFFCLGQ